jgi:ribosomal protein S18 acetylase RimI-like enzyme
MSIRRLVPADAPAYRALMLEAYERHPDAFTSSVAERSALPLAWWESRLRLEPLPSDVVFGAFGDGRLVGVAGLSFEAREKARHKATLYGMYVLPEFRQAGLGRELVLASLEHARTRDGVKLVQLTVTHGNKAAQALYERCGFVQFGLEPFAVAVGSGFVSKVHMWCNLGFSKVAATV